MGNKNICCPAWSHKIHLVSFSCPLMSSFCFLCPIITNLPQWLPFEQHTNSLCKKSTTKDADLWGLLVPLLTVSILPPYPLKPRSRDSSDWPIWFDWPINRLDAPSGSWLYLGCGLCCRGARPDIKAYPRFKGLAVVFLSPDNIACQHLSVCPKGLMRRRENQPKRRIPLHLQPCSNITVGKERGRAWEYYTNTDTFSLSHRETSAVFLLNIYDYRTLFKVQLRFYSNFSIKGEVKTNFEVTHLQWWAQGNNTSGLASHFHSQWAII